ncbi:MAG: PilN domain-containing protein [Phycisphaerales bacterium]|nr:PilN domain-containing protein [Phycisphaerales bacterium]MCI0632279.1 PilN domain-containing protein [Phycisphaerales bacterium]MCI0675953.1 PilN domain-containing protein [Phycisphaerales bacterium]
MTQSSFLPEDYLAQKAQHRTNIISLTLFGVVMSAVVGAFFVTNRQAQLVKNLQETVNAQCLQAGSKIDELKQLDLQKEEMLQKAELAGALVERVPRSILLAELINRMPEKLALLTMDLKSERIKVSAKETAMEKDGKGRMKPGTERAKTKQQVGETVAKPETPRYKVTIVMTGVAPTDLEVSKFMSELNAYALLRDVTLEYSEQKVVNEVAMRQFKINMALDPDADVRRVSPLMVPRVKNPMVDQMEFNIPGRTNAGSRGKQGD